ncbi:hypothetical protein BCV70DRAFT_201034 [Testicularia cyperi]|uniref:Autophagy-related protein 14 n=1 Tax=Testicularia cyperi TaxID=1882483 RepID=A0A317XQ48_9BASI|nr:hypothetical protein BCV70DRAFT_201034 [Testicularia cyperi]
MSDAEDVDGAVPGPGPGTEAAAAAAAAAAAVSATETADKPRDRRPSQSRSRRNSAQGYSSDPGAAARKNRTPGDGASTDPKRQAGMDARKAYLEERRRVLELSLRETKMMHSYTLDEARSLVSHQAELWHMIDEVRDLEARQSRLVVDPDGLIQLRLKRNQRRAQLDYTRRLRDDERQEAQQKQATLELRRAQLHARREALDRSKALLIQSEQHDAQIQDAIQTAKQRQSDLALAIHTEHAALFRDLETVFPIDLADASSLLFSICGLPLPNDAASISPPELEKEEKRWKESIRHVQPPSHRPLFHHFDDDTISSALGMVAQLVVLLSVYLSTPIHYPIATAGSRAVVQDCISLMSGPRAFPLYAKGVERYRYEYAAFLLNKNIEQLMNVHSVTVIDIRQTLPNLKNLMVTLSAAPPTSQRTRKSHIGKNEIALRSTSVSTSASSLVPTHMHTIGTATAKEESGFATGTGNGSANSNVNGTTATRIKKLSGLGLGLPTSVKPVPSSAGADHPSIAIAKDLDGHAETTDTLVTTRVLGSTTSANTTTASSAPSANPGGAIDSVARALSYFAGSRRG